LEEDGVIVPLGGCWAAVADFRISSWKPELAGVLSEAFCIIWGVYKPSTEELYLNLPASNSF